MTVAGKLRIIFCPHLKELAKNTQIEDSKKIINKIENQLIEQTCNSSSTNYFFIRWFNYFNWKCLK